MGEKVSVAGPVAVFGPKSVSMPAEYGMLDKESL